MKSISPITHFYIQATVICLAGTVLSACQQTHVSIDVSKQTYLHEIAVESILVLNQDIQISPSNARIYFQHGAQVDSPNIDKYQAWCEFEVRTLSDKSETIRAGDFHIHKLVNERSGLLDGMVSGFMSNTLEEFSTLFYLRSANQPDVFRLTCLRRKGTRMKTYLTLKDMQAALGNIITLNIK